MFPAGWAHSVGGCSSSRRDCTWKGVKLSFRSPSCRASWPSASSNCSSRSQLGREGRKGAQGRAPHPATPSPEGPPHRKARPLTGRPSGRAVRCAANSPRGCRGPRRAGAPARGLQPRPAAGGGHGCRAVPGRSRAQGALTCLMVSRTTAVEDTLKALQAVAGARPGAGSASSGKLRL